jgi:(p)ppGpp synthase/HD superfamily hydrolase
MDNTEKNELEKMVLAPYIQKATALRGKYRYVGGNQFRHALGTFAILLDYHYMDPVLLKASFIHDLFEDTKCVSPEEIIHLDKDGPEVYKLVIEVTRTKSETKDEFLERILMNGSTYAKILKCADRISNLTDLHTDIFDKEFIKNYIEESKNWVIPMAEQVNKQMLYELKDIIQRRERHFKIPTHIWPLTRKDKED